jgi:hypothetical protein
VFALYPPHGWRWKVYEVLMYDVVMNEFGLSDRVLYIEGILWI